MSRRHHDQFEKDINTAIRLSLQMAENELLEQINSTEGAVNSAEGAANSNLERIAEVDDFIDKEENFSPESDTFTQQLNLQLLLLKNVENDRSVHVNNDYEGRDNRRPRSPFKHPDRDQTLTITRNSLEPSGRKVIMQFKDQKNLNNILGPISPPDNSNIEQLYIEDSENEFPNLYEWRNTTPEMWLATGTRPKTTSTTLKKSEEVSIIPDNTISCASNCNCDCCTNEIFTTTNIKNLLLDNSYKTNKLYLPIIKVDIPEDELIMPFYSTAIDSPERGLLNILTAPDIPSINNNLITTESNLQKCELETDQHVGSEIISLKMHNFDDVGKSYLENMNAYTTNTEYPNKKMVPSNESYEFANPDHISLFNADSDNIDFEFIKSVYLSQEQERSKSHYINKRKRSYEPTANFQENKNKSMCNRTQNINKNISSATRITESSFMCLINPGFNPENNQNSKLWEELVSSIADKNFMSPLTSGIHIEYEGGHCNKPDKTFFSNECHIVPTPDFDLFNYCEKSFTNLHVPMSNIQFSQNDPNVLLHSNFNPDDYMKIREGQDFNFTTEDEYIKLKTDQACLISHVDDQYKSLAQLLNIDEINEDSTVDCSIKERNLIDINFTSKTPSGEYQYLEKDEDISLSQYNLNSSEEIDILEVDIRHLPDLQEAGQINNLESNIDQKSESITRPLLLVPSTQNQEITFITQSTQDQEIELISRTASSTPNTPCKKITSKRRRSNSFNSRLHRSKYNACRF